MNAVEKHVNQHLVAIQHEQAAKALQNLAAQAAGRGDYIGAYEFMGKAAREWAAASTARKLALGFKGVSA